MQLALLQATDSKETVTTFGVFASRAEAAHAALQAAAVNATAVGGSMPGAQPMQQLPGAAGDGPRICGSWQQTRVPTGKYANVQAGCEQEHRGDAFPTECKTPCNSAAGRLAMREPSLQCVPRAHPLRLNLPSRGAAVGPVAQIAAAAAIAGNKLDVSPTCDQL